MKAVAMMKKAIKDSELFGYKWTADKEGLHWEYCDITFEFSQFENGDGCVVYMFHDPEADVRSRSCVVGSDLKNFIDNDLFFEDADEAIYRAAKKMIRRANETY